MENFLKTALYEAKNLIPSGNLASYIPELSKVDKNLLGICILDENGNQICCGDYNHFFTIQSISKVFTLILALMDNGCDLYFSKIGAESTNYSFNSIYVIDFNGVSKPINPMLNAGAIATIPLIHGKDYLEKFNRAFNLIKKICCNENLKINNQVYISEKNTASRNKSIAYYLESLKIIPSNVDEILDAYFKLCSIEISCSDLARAGIVIAMNGFDPITKTQIFPKEVSKIARTIMASCGMYNSSGEFALKVGIPSKSAVSGGILSVIPKKLGIGILGPSIDLDGNSIAGMKILELLSKEFNLSIF